MDPKLPSAREPATTEIAPSQAWFHFCKEEPKAAKSVETKDMDLYRQVRGGPVEDDETGDYGAARNIAEEHEDPTQNFRWSPDVLFACDKLPPLKPEDVKTLGSLLGFSSTSLPGGVKDFLLAFESHPDHCQHLRKLAQQLKSLGREDIVSAMRREKAALRWLGPVLPEGHLVRDLFPSLWMQLTLKLSLSHPQGYDWKWLAEQLSIPRDFIDLWQQQGDYPADKVLKAWQVKVSEATVGRLFDLLIEHREDLAAML